MFRVVALGYRAGILRKGYLLIFRLSLKASGELRRKISQ